MFSGYDSTFKNHNDLWSFDLKNKIWKQLKADGDPASPSKLYIFCFELDDANKNIYIFGGNYREKDTVQRKDLWQYNIASNQFTPIIADSFMRFPSSFYTPLS